MPSLDRGIILEEDAGVIEFADAKPLSSSAFSPLTNLISAEVITKPMTKYDVGDLISRIQERNNNQDFHVELAQMLVKLATQADFQTFITKHILKPVLDVMKMHRHQFEVQLNCCWVLGYLAADEQNRKSVAESSLDDMLLALRSSTNLTYIQVEILKVLIGFARHSAIQPPHAAAAIDAALLTLRANAHTPEIQSLCCQLLAYLSADPSNKPAMSQRVVPDAIAAMQRHPSLASLQARACAILANTPLDPTDKRALLASALPAVLAAMRTHRAVPDVQAHACRALRNLALDSAQV
jgi:hypothetical protein